MCRKVVKVNERFLMEDAEIEKQHLSCCPVLGCILIILLIFCAEIKKLEEQYHAIEIPNEEGVVTYFKIRQQLAKLGKEIQEFVHKPKYCLPFLQPGRLVKVELHTQ